MIIHTKLNNLFGRRQLTNKQTNQNYREYTCKWKTHAKYYFQLRIMWRSLNSKNGFKVKKKDKFSFFIEFNSLDHHFLRFDFIGWSASLVLSHITFFFGERECDNKLVKYVPHKLNASREEKHLLAIFFFSNSWFSS